MHLAYSKKDFFIFKNLKIKKTKKIIYNEKDLLFNLNHNLGPYVLKILNFYKLKNISLLPVNLLYPFFIYNQINDNSLDYDLLKSSHMKMMNYISCSIYINNSKSELYFPFLDIKIKPEEGDLILHKSSIEYSYYNKKIEKGDDFILKSFFRIKNDIFE